MQFRFSLWSIHFITHIFIHSLIVLFTGKYIFVHKHFTLSRMVVTFVVYFTRRPVRIKHTQSNFAQRSDLTTKSRTLNCNRVKGEVKNGVQHGGNCFIGENHICISLIRQIALWKSIIFLLLSLLLLLLLFIYLLFLFWLEIITFCEFVIAVRN